MKKKVIYLPIEVKAREYRAKLLFALYAINEGYQVVIGSRVPLKQCIMSLPPGIYLGSSIMHGHGEDYKKFKNAGHEVVAFDEEGLIPYSDPENRRIHDETLRLVNHFFTWGETHLSIIQNKVSDISNCTAMGNMRFELLKSKYRKIYMHQIKKIQDKYGRFILINSNLVCNNINSKDFFHKMTEKVRANYNANERNDIDKLIDYHSEIFEAYKSLIMHLSSNVKPFNIVIRPHPMENEELWKPVESDNVFVVKEGDVIPWILASELVIQKNCTTAFESVFLDKPVITYNAVCDSQFDVDIIEKIGKICNDENQVLKAINNLNELHEQVELDKRMLSKHISNMNVNDNVAHNVLGILDNIKIQPVDDDSRLFRSLAVIKTLIAMSIHTLRCTLSRQPFIKNDKVKFRKLGKKEFLKDIHSLATAIGINPKEIRCSKIYNNLFYITKK